MKTLAGSKHLITQMLLLISIIALIEVTSCNKPDVPKGTPKCIISKIKQIESEAVRNPPAEVWQYDYKGQSVFYITSYCCDVPSELYDADCNLICRPDGGFIGSGDGTCTDFFSNRSNEKLIWKDGR